MNTCMRRLAALGTAMLFALGTTGVACGHAEPPAPGTADTTITPLLVQPLPESPEQTFCEAPTDIHVVGRNASATGKAKFLVFFIKNVGAAPVLPVE